MLKLTPTHFGIIKPSNIPPALRRVVGMDSEDDGKGHPIAFAFHDGERAWHFTRARDAIAFILAYPGPAIFVAHNLEYDLGNLFKDGDFGFVRQMVYSHTMIMAMLRECKNVLQNSQAFFSGSVGDMGKILGLPKLPFDPRSKDYVIRDAEIVQRFMAKVQERLYTEFGVSMGASLGQTAARLFSDRFSPFRGFKTYNNPDILNSFYGGRTEIYEVGTHEKKISDADIHSAYPHAMKANGYPDCRHLRSTRVGSALYGVGRFAMRVPDMPFPPLPWRSATGRVYFPTGLISGVWTYAEVKRAVELGCTILREAAGVGTDYTIYPFGPFVDTLFEKKQDAGRARDANPDSTEARFLYEFYKLLLNAGYGKLIQHKPEGVLTYEKPEGEALRVGPFWSSKLPLLRPPPASNYLWGTHVTAHGRLHLLKQILKVAEDKASPLYCDTDAVMYTGAAALDFGDGLGQLSRKEYDAAYFRQSKGYVLCRKEEGGYLAEKIAAKGVPREHGLAFLARGMASVMKPVRLKRGLVRGTGGATDFERAEGLNVWSEVERKMRTEYMKRPKDVGNRTRAPRVSEVADIEARMQKVDIPDFTLRMAEPRN